MTRAFERVFVLLLGLVFTTACATLPVRPDETETTETTEIEAAGVSTPEPIDATVLDSEEPDDDVAVEESITDADAPSEEERKAARLRELEEQIQPGMDLALAMLRAGDEQGALKQYESLAQEAPDAFVVHYNVGLLRERAGDVDAARTAYRRALELEPGYAPASENLVRSYLRGEDFGTAESELRRRLSSRKDDLALRNQLVRVLLARGRNDEAEKEAKRILARDERNVTAMLHLASLWHGQGKYELVRQVLENAKEIEPSNAAVWNGLAFAQLELDMRPQALESFRKAAELSEEYAEAHNNLGALLNEANDCDGAITALENAARWAPQHPHVRLNLGNAYRCARRFADAEAQYRRALELDEALKDAWFNLAILHLDGDFEGVDTADRLRTSLAHFERYASAGGGDERLSRYQEEATKALTRETDRLARVAERERQARERAEREAEKRRVEEEKARLAAEERRQAIESRKVAVKSSLEDDPVIAEATPSPPARYQVTRIADGGK